MSGPGPGGTDHFIGVQFLRFFAAFVVLVFHASFYLSSRIDASVATWNAGAQGVEIFFVISGFVMALATRPLRLQADGFRYFVLSRIIRIVPLYWTVNLAKFSLMFVAPALIYAEPDIRHLVLSMLFVPHTGPSGAIEAFHGVGWTLNFEMYFYAIFAAALLLRARVAFVCAALVLTAALSLLPGQRDFLSPDSWPALTWLFNSIVLNFTWGIVIAHVVSREREISDAVSAVLLATGTVIFFAYPQLELLELQYAFIVAGVVFLENRIGRHVPAVFVFGGNASYSLYLVHPMAAIAVAMLLAAFSVTSPVLCMSAMIIASLVVAACVYHYFELPVTRYLRRRVTGGMVRGRVVAVGA